MSEAFAFNALTYITKFAFSFTACGSPLSAKDVAPLVHGYRQRQVKFLFGARAAGKFVKSMWAIEEIDQSLFFFKKKKKNSARFFLIRYTFMQRADLANLVIV